MSFDRPNDFVKVAVAYPLDNMRLTEKLYQYLLSWRVPLTTQGSIPIANIAGANERTYIALDELKEKALRSWDTYIYTIEHFSINKFDMSLMFVSDHTDIDFFSDILHIFATLEENPSWEAAWISEPDGLIVGKVDSGIIFTDGYFLDVNTISDLYRSFRDLQRDDRVVYDQ